MLEEVAAALGTTAAAAATVVVSLVAIYLAVIVATRTAGPRSLAQMSAFDFIATVAVGSMVASVGLGSVPLTDGLIAVALLFALQYLVALVRQRGTLKGAIDNQPLLLVQEGQVLEDHLRAARLTYDDLRAHLRRADVTDVSEVRAVVLETTGEVSVLQGDGDVGPVLQGVRGADGHRGPRGQLSGG